MDWTTFYAATAGASATLLGLLRVWAPVWQRMFRDQRGQFWELLWLVASPLTAYLVMAVLATQMVHNGPSPDLQQEIGYCVVGLFAIVLRNSCEKPTGQIRFTFRPG